jgi:hypothetical protein
MARDVADLVERRLPEHVGLRLWRIRCEPTNFCGGFRPVFLNASSSTVFTIWASLKGGGCGVFAERNSAREESPVRPLLMYSTMASPTWVEATSDYAACPCRG